MPTPERFAGSRDGDSVRAFIATVDNYFDLVHLQDTHQQARFVYSLLSGPAVDWFVSQKYTLGNISWPALKLSMQKAFVPADWERVCLTKLRAAK